MLKEAKKALRITAEIYDEEIAALIRAGAQDLKLAGILVPDEIAFSAKEDGTIEDNSTLKDDLIIRAILTYVRANFGSPSDYDRLKAAYDEQKAQMMMATGYTTGYPYAGGDAE